MNPRQLVPATLAVLALLAAGAIAARAETAASDPRAVAIADQVMTALGGKKTWDAVPGLRWTFEVMVNDTTRFTRRHAWDKHGGMYRVDGKTRDGVPFVFIRNLNTNVGHAWMGGKPIEGDSLQKLLKRTMSIWINDSYWLLMPYKLRDPGVTLKYAGDTTFAGRTYDRVALSFENVGDTPGDRYWIFVNRASHRIEQWNMLLQGDTPPPNPVTLEGWEQHGGLWFATMHHEPMKKGVAVMTKDIAMVTAFDRKEFAGP